MAPAARAAALQEGAAGDAVMAAALSRPRGAGRLLCALHTHTSRVEEEEDAALTEVREGECFGVSF